MILCSDLLSCMSCSAARCRMAQKCRKEIIKDKQPRGEETALGEEKWRIPIPENVWDELLRPERYDGMLLASVACTAESTLHSNFEEDAHLWHRKVHAQVEWVWKASRLGRTLQHFKQEASWRAEYWRSLLARVRSKHILPHPLNMLHQQTHVDDARPPGARST